MKVLYHYDIKEELDRQIQMSFNNDLTIRCIELDDGESRDFVKLIPSDDIQVIEEIDFGFYAKDYYYKGVQIKLAKGVFY